MVSVRAIVLALAVVASACAGSGAIDSPTGPSGPSTPTTPNQEFTTVTIFNGLPVSMENVGTWNGWTILAKFAAPLTAGDVKVYTSVVSGDAPMYYLFPHSADGNINSANWVKCFKAPFDCSAKLAGPVVGVKGGEVVVGHVSGLDINSVDLMFLTKTGPFVGSINIFLTAPK